jgi:hypothetical protein
MEEIYRQIWQIANNRAYWSPRPDVNAAKIRDQPLLALPFLVACPLSMVNDLVPFLRDPLPNMGEDALPMSVVTRVLEDRAFHEIFIREIPRAIISGRMCQTSRGADSWVDAMTEFRYKIKDKMKVIDILDDEWKKAINPKESKTINRFREFIKNEMLPNHVYFLSPAVVLEMANTMEYHSSFLRNIVNKSLAMNLLMPETARAINKTLEAAIHHVAHRRVVAMCDLGDVDPEALSKLGNLILQKVESR